MKKTIYYLFCLLPFLVLYIFSPLFAQEKLEIYFFWGQGCPHCAQEKPFLEKLKQKYPQLVVKDFEVYYNKENQELFQKIAKAYNTSALGVPMTFIGKEFVVGFGTAETTGKQIEELIQKCLKENCPSPSKILSAGGIDKIDSNSTQTTISQTTISLTTKGTKFPEENQLCIHFFIKEECPQCKEIEDFLIQIAKKYKIDFTIYNISDPENATLLEKLQQYYNISLVGYPVVFLGDSYLVGNESIKENIEKIINRCQKTNCPCPVEEIQRTFKIIPKPSTFTPSLAKEFSIDLFGKEIKLSSTLPLLALGLILGLVDGINPCMFSVLLFLLTYLLAIGSKKKAIKVGLVFTLGVFIIYFLFMLGMINLINLIGFIQIIKSIIAIIALIAGILMLKDFFFYGKWISLEIPEKSKPFIEKLIKKATLPSALILAFFSSFVELPCTAGIPLVYTTLLATKGGSYIPYLIWYNLFFIVPLLIIILGTSFVWGQTEKVEKWRQNFRRYMRLTAGLILLFLAIALFKGWV